MRIAFFGSSLLSSYWNGAATYYRGILSALAKHGYRTTFYEPDAFDRQQHRDIEPPDWAEVIVYPATLKAVHDVCAEATRADVIVKASGIGIHDDEILSTLLGRNFSQKIRIFWDVDAPATLAAIASDACHPLRTALPRLDAVLTYGGGAPVVAAYQGFGARFCVPIYNGLDPATHHRVAADPRFAADLAFLGNRLPDREARVEQFFFTVARRLPHRRFLLGGAGWEPWQLPANLHYVGHVSTRDHNAFNSTPLAIINIARDSMASTGFSPATRVFEAAGAAACLITDAWQGIEAFLQPEEEVLVAENADAVVDQLAKLSCERARQIGDRALRRVLREHSYQQRGAMVAGILENLAKIERKRAIA
jgi:spore maturation protein CgeB